MATLSSIDASGHEHDSLVQWLTTPSNSDPFHLINLLLDGSGLQQVDESTTLVSGPDNPKTPAAASKSSRVQLVWSEANEPSLATSMTSEKSL